jgi:hypothetical protein
LALNLHNSFQQKATRALVSEIMGNDRHEQSANAILPLKHELDSKLLGFCGKNSGNVKKGRPEVFPSL